MDGLKLIREAKRRGLKLWARGDRLVIRGPRRHAALASELLRRKAEVMAYLRSSSASALEAEGRIDAVKLSSPTYGELWLVRDQEALDCNPDIEASGLPVVFFAEVEILEAIKDDPQAIQRFLALKAAFPRGQCRGRNERLQ